MRSTLASDAKIDLDISKLYIQLLGRWIHGEKIVAETRNATILFI